jgi:hypothetical protein
LKDSQNGKAQELVVSMAIVLITRAAAETLMSGYGPKMHTKGKKKDNSLPSISLDKDRGRSFRDLRCKEGRTSSPVRLEFLCASASSDTIACSFPNAEVYQYNQQLVRKKMCMQSAENMKS